MLQRIELSGSEAFLASYRPTLPSFRAHARMSRSLVPIWDAIAGGQTQEAYRLARATLTERSSASVTERAGILAGLAGAEYASGRLDHALRTARQSLDLVSAQWTARRVIICVLFRRREYEDAYRELSGLPVDLNGPSWDEKLKTRDVEIALASASWLLGEWDAVERHLGRAHPAGVAQMDEALREDCFRIAMYRNRPSEAAMVAGLLVPEWPPDRSDELLQTLVQRGFTAQALPLYRAVFGLHPDSELVRRRLVALCIKEGEIEEARRLAAPAALRSAA